MLVHQVSEPNTDASFYLVCKVSYDCVRKLLPTVKFESSTDILTMKDCWIEDKAFQQDYMILSAIDVSAYKEELSASSYRTVLTILFYHFRHEKHASMSEYVNQGLKHFTKTPACNNFRKRYWLN